MKEMYTKKMLITPEMAERYLQTNQRNRNIKGYKVQKLEDDIKNGDWIVTHQGIAIDSNGKLIDGHHRLTAILKTGISCEMMVTFNAVESEKIDIGASRTDRDSMFMANVIEKSSVEYNRITYPLIGYIIDRSLGANKSKAVSATAKHILYTKLKKYIDPVIEATNASSGKGKTKSAAVLYAMCCALKGGVSKETIKQWHKITATGDFYVEGNEEMTKVGRSVMLFKDYADGRMKRDSTEQKDTTVKKAESSIRHYAERNVITKLYGEIAYPEITITEKDLRRS